MYDFCFTPIYAALLALGGVVGFLTKGSLASLGLSRWHNCRPLTTVSLCGEAPVPCHSFHFLLPPVFAGGGLGSAALLSACTYVSLQSYHRGQLCRSSTLLSLGLAGNGTQ